MNTLNPRTEKPIYGYFFLIAFILTLQFSPIVGLIFFNITGDQIWTSIGIVKDFIVIVLALMIVCRALLTFRFNRFIPSSLWALALIISISTFAIISSSDWVYTLLNLRRLLMFPLIFFVVLSLRLTPSQVSSLIRFVLMTTFVVGFLGVLEYLAPNLLWSDYLQVINYFNANPLDPFKVSSLEESGRFFSWDLFDLIGMPIRRAVSTYLEPTTLASGLAVGVILALQAKRLNIKGAKIKLFFILLCGLLTISKAFLFYLIIMMTYIFFRVPSINWLFSLTGIAVIFAFMASSIGLTEGKFEHISGLASAVDNVLDGHFFGQGIGNAGNYAIDGSDLSVGAESGLGNMLAQIGVLSIFFIFWIKSIASDVSKLSANNYEGVYFIAILLGWYFSFLYSASSLGVGGNSLVFLVLALHLRKHSSKLLQR